MTATKARRTGAVIGMITLAATSLAACSDGSGGAATESGSVRVASPAPDSLFTYNEMVARELGFYADEDLEVELVALSDAIPAAALVQNGEADAALISATDALAAASKAEDLRLAYDERTGGTDFIYGIVVPSESGIEDLTELEGENIGLASPDQDLALLASALEQVDMTLDDVETTVVGPGGSSVAESLRSGRIAGYAGTLQDFAAFGDAGLEVDNILPEGLEGLPVGGYVTTTSTLEADDDMVKFLRALAKGTYVALERPEIAALVTQEGAPEQWREPEVAEFLLEGLAATLVPFDGETFGEIKTDRWQNAQDLLIEVGVMDDPADLDVLLDDDLIEEINDWDREEVLARADEWLAEHGAS
ncbi:ABC transporter substrate-binding protein [Nocardioides bizhenqiangii]|uniref:ABC transporter substrate-binding protein n=1 Tax=Nocardioides bizhenqiangii TaxID=3095076 RepID=A0ABZ0ZUF4_9ACTN|nr:MULTISPECIES: ABC transporter substrate-binding protein [unclassified Nocardioides]MDZ5621753.1 ABC transporter substrate-binding protein [Nocardioides sp. HM23]WQQ27561.1 ABC transporter substrate-binding protein [Nocardioides sp. HM61]